MTITAYHFVGETLRDGLAIPPDGEWLTHEGDAVMCESGLHASRDPFDALQYAPGATLCKVECDGVVSEQDDKIVCRRRKIVKRFDATKLCRIAGRKYALAAIHLWDAPAVVRKYLQTGDESKRAAAGAAAWAAARDAAGAAAWGAAWAAARDAARDAAWAAARDAAGAAAWGAARAAAGAAAWAAARAAARDAAGAAARDAAGAAAGAAAWGAARAAARDAAGAAAWGAARAAARDAQRKIFNDLVAEALGESEQRTSRR